jgi:hypothetical protein
MEHLPTKERRLDEPGEVQQDQVDAARREALAKIGRFVYVAPALALLAQPKGAQAGYGRGGTRPGWGYGDKNHIHTGPPGLLKNLLKKK